MKSGGNQSTASTSANYDQRQVNTWNTSSYDLSNRSTNTTSADFSNRSVNTNTTNTTTNADFSDRSTTNNTTDTTTNLWSDSSNRSTTNTTTNADFSNRSTSWSDSSNRSVTDNSDHSTTTVYNTTTDGGAVAGALALGGAAVQQAGSQLAGVLGFASQVVDGQNASTANGYAFADHLFNHALDTVHDSESAAMDAFGRAAQVQSSTINQLQSAYADAKGTSAAQQKIILAVLAVAALAMIAKR